MHHSHAGAEQSTEVVDLILARSPSLDRGMVSMLVGPGEARDHHAVLARDDDGTALGCGLLRDLDHLPAAWRLVYVVTRPDGAGQKLASATYAALLEQVVPEVEVLITMAMQDDPGSVAVARHWGFEPMQLSITASMDVSRAAEPVPETGVSFEGCDDLVFPDDEAVEAMLQASQTNPEADAGLRMSLPSLRGSGSDGQHLLAVLARVDGRPAAISVGVRDQHESGEMHVMYSGVDPELRGQGLALRTKQFLHAHAARAGVTTAITDNEEDNSGIRHVNEQLGYRVRYAVYWLARPAG